ncbi:shikimate kinase [Parablautia muri]|uniref:shikimate kinase n=1 Tax=Parablautia muri TaxID=2320879 RepID=UPI002412682E|nr:shikimate kinase [Parablautia muri]
MKNNVILIGFMGSGKTSVGIRLSYHLKRTMIDTDKWIEQRQKMSISDLFAEKGEAAFREMETDCLKELIRTADHQIISVGGGLPMRKENHALLKELGKVFYLKITPEAVYERLKSDTTRPLLQVENPKEKIRALLEERAPVYEACADVAVEVSDKTFEQIIKEICAESR